MRVETHHGDEVIDVAAGIDGKEALRAVASHVHAEVLLHRLSWCGLENGIDLGFEGVNVCFGILGVHDEKVVCIHDDDHKLFAGL